MNPTELFIALACLLLIRKEFPGLGTNVRDDDLDGLLEIVTHQFGISEGMGTDRPIRPKSNTGEPGVCQWEPDRWRDVLAAEPVLTSDFVVANLAKVNALPMTVRPSQFRRSLGKTLTTHAKNLLWFEIADYCKYALNWLQKVYGFSTQDIGQDSLTLSGAIWTRLLAPSITITEKHESEPHKGAADDRDRPTYADLVSDLPDAWETSLGGARLDNLHRSMMKCLLDFDIGAWLKHHPKSRSLSEYLRTAVYGGPFARGGTLSSGLLWHVLNLRGLRIEVPALKMGKIIHRFCPHCEAPDWRLWKHPCASCNNEINDVDYGHDKLFVLETDKILLDDHERAGWELVGCDVDKKDVRRCTAPSKGISDGEAEGGAASYVRVAQFTKPIPEGKRKVGIWNAYRLTKQTWVSSYDDSRYGSTSGSQSDVAVKFREVRHLLSEPEAKSLELRIGLSGEPPMPDVTSRAKKLGISLEELDRIERSAEVKLLRCLSEKEVSHEDDA